MSSHKRTHQALKTPVAILQYLQSVLGSEYYQDVQDCVFEHDRHLQKTQQQCKKSCPEAFLYTKACSAMFADLHNVLTMHCEFMHVYNKLFDVSCLVEMMISSTSLQNQNQNQNINTDNGHLDETQATENEKIAVQLKTERFQQSIAEITVRFHKNLREDKEQIANTNLQLRFSLKYKTLSRILHLARGNEECGILPENGEIDKWDPTTNKTQYSLIDSLVKHSNAYEALKNKCMLGAILRYTERRKKWLETERDQTRIGSLCVNSLACMNGLEDDLIKNAIAMLQTTHSQNDMKVKITKTLEKTKSENILLQMELDSVLAKIKQIQE